MGAAGSVSENENPALFQDPKDKFKAAGNKVELYRLIKQEFQKIEDKKKTDPKMSDFGAAEEVATNLGLSEDLILAIFSPKSHPKISTVAIAATKAVVVERKSPIFMDGADAPPRSPRLASPVAALPIAPLPLSEEAREKLKRIANCRFQNFLVGADGSANAKVAFETALALRKTKGKFFLLHIEDLSKTYLPRAEKWEGICEAAEVQLVTRVPPSLYVLENIVKREDESTKTCFMNQANSIDLPLFVCVGWVGRKGPKSDPSVLGSVTDIALRTCVHPVIICKEAPKAEEEHSYVVCVDGLGERGLYMFECTMAMVKNIDKVTVVFVYNDRELGVKNDVEKFYKQQILDNGYDNKKVSFKAILNQLKPVYEPLAEFMNDQQPTFVVMGPDTNLERRELMSCSEHLLKLCKHSNFIMLKVEKAPKV